MLQKVGGHLIKGGAILVALSAPQPVSAQATSAAPPAQLPTLPKVVPDCERAGAEGEIVVCARRSPNDRYRVPEGLRSDPRRGGNTAGPHVRRRWTTLPGPGDREATLPWDRAGRRENGSRCSGTGR